MPTFSEFADAHDITMSTVPLAGAALARRQREWGGIPATHTKCTLRRGQQSMTLPFSFGSGIPEAELEDVLRSVAVDAGMVEQSELAEDTKEGRALAKQLEQQAGRARRFLGDEAFEELLHETYETNPTDDGVYVVNPNDPVLSTGAGAGIGSLAGVILGSFLGSPTLGSMVGGALGGYYAAPEDRKSRGGWGGGIGGMFTPIGAVAGGAIAGRKPGKAKRNPSTNLVDSMTSEADLIRKLKF
jgi:hypothetical protein